MTTATARGPARVPRLGFLGVGGIGRQQLEAIADSGVAEIAMVADRSLSAALDASAFCCGVDVTTGLSDLLAADLDGLVIGTPDAVRAGHAIAALAAGVAVFCRPPLATTAAGARRVVEAAQRSDRLLGVDLSYRQMAGIRLVKRLIEAGEMGDIFAIETTFHCLSGLELHLVDLALWMLGSPDVTSVSGRLMRTGRPRRRKRGGLDDYAVARVDVATPASISLACSHHLPSGQGATIRFACYGSRADALLENVAGSSSDFRAWLQHGTHRRLLAGPPDNWNGRAIVEWVERLARDCRFSHDAFQQVQVAQVLDRVYAS